MYYSAGGGNYRLPDSIILPGKIAFIFLVQLIFGKINEDAKVTLLKKIPVMCHHEDSLFVYV